MRQDSRLSRLLHVLLHMEGHDTAITSETIATMLGSNSAVVRRTMAGLREAGYVTSEKGHGGGWRLARPLNEITLLDVYKALGEPEIFAFGLADPAPQCLVERAVNTAMRDALRQSQEVLLTRFGEIALSDIARDFDTRAGEMGIPTHLAHTAAAAEHRHK